ncbi:hypothetical protein ACW9HQ_53220, partial [Nocardia gipuzkoensis]
VWTMGWPFHARRRLHQFRLTATDTDWTAGEGPEIQGPILPLLLLLTGRPIALRQLTGPGRDELDRRIHAPERTIRSTGPES